MLHWGTCEGERVEGTCYEEEKENRHSQGKDPRTFDENSQGGDLRTLETNSQGRDPRTLKEPVERWRGQEKRKEKKWKKKRKKKKKKKLKHRRRSWLNKCKERIVTFLHGEDEIGKERKGKPRQKQTSQGERQVLGKSGIK